jgi:hypothetical protein
LITIKRLLKKQPFLINKNMEPTLHINLGYIIVIFSILATISGFLIWIITKILAYSNKTIKVDNLIDANHKEIESELKAMKIQIEQLKTDKVSITVFTELSSEIKHLNKSMDEIKNFIYNYKDKEK